MKRITPTKAIRRKCIDCCAGTTNEIRACPVTDCPIWGFRLGLNPFTKKNKGNPFLQADNFTGLENRQASEVIKIIGGKE